MCPNGDRPPPLLLSLAACLLLLTAGQCIWPMAAESSSPAFARIASPVGIHVREEVADGAIDLARDARREVRHPLTQPEAPVCTVHFDEIVEVEVSRPRRIFHRRVSPPSSDCIC